MNNNEQKRSDVKSENTFEYLTPKKNAFVFTHDKFKKRNYKIFEQLNEIKSIYFHEEFYLEAEIKNLHSLFNSFNFPQTIWDDLIFFYLNMRFAVTNSESNTERRKELLSLRDEAKELYSFIQDLDSKQKSLISFAIYSLDLKTKVASSKIFKADFIRDILVKLLLNCKDSIDYLQLKTASTMFSEVKRINLHLGYKNDITMKQYFFIESILFYFEKYEKNIKNLSKTEVDLKKTNSLKVPKRRTLLFIGRLMIAAKLLQDNDQTDDVLIDLLKKKTLK